MLLLGCGMMYVVCLLHRRLRDMPRAACVYVGVGVRAMGSCDAGCVVMALREAELELAAREAEENERGFAMLVSLEEGLRV